MSNSQVNVGAKLNDGNYQTWKFKLRMLLLREGTWSVVNEIKPNPSPEDWAQKDEKAQTSISLNVEDSQIIHICQCNTARSMWLELQKVHERDNFDSPNKLLLLRKLYQTKLEDQIMQDYIRVNLETVETLRGMGEDIKDAHVVALLLSGLPDDYKSLVTAIDARPYDELTLDYVKGKLMDEYEQRIVKSGNGYALEESAMKVEMDEPGSVERVKIKIETNQETLPQDDCLQKFEEPIGPWHTSERDAAQSDSMLFLEETKDVLNISLARPVTRTLKMNDGETNYVESSQSIKGAHQFKEFHADVVCKEIKEEIDESVTVEEVNYIPETIKEELSPHPLDFCLVKTGISEDQMDLTESKFNLQNEITGKMIDCSSSGATIQTKEMKKLMMTVFSSTDQENHKAGLNGHVNSDEKPCLCGVNHSREQGVCNSQFCSTGLLTRDNLEPLNIAKAAHRPFTCVLCAAKFLNKRALMLHTRTHTGEKPFKCISCPAKFTQKGHLVCHMRSHTGEKPFKCETCSGRFASKNALKGHIRTHTGEKPYKCDTCLTRFTWKAHLVRHIRSHTGEKPFKCGSCSATFASNSNLTLHIRTHTGEKPFTCDTCSATFTSKGNLTYHMQMHTGEKPFKCTLCLATFSSKGSLTYHVRSHTGEKPFQCDSCPSTFARKSDLTLHIRTHTGELLWNCEFCSAKFTSKRDFVNHTRTHTGEKPFKCDSCTAKFTQRAHLDYHIRTHTGEKPFMCDACPSRFASKSGLTSHMRTHTGEKPFSCELCSVRFARKDHLVRHVRMHTGEKPYKCDTCLSAFAHKKDLTAHIQTHADEILQA